MSTKCQCGTWVDNAFPYCPKCGTARQIQQVAAQTPAPRIAPPGLPSNKWLGYPKGEWLIAGALFLIGIPFIYHITHTPKAPAPERAFDSTDALIECQLAMTNASRDPEKAEIPPVPKNELPDAYLFTWGGATRLMRLRNGFGLEVGVPGICIVNKTTKQITLLIIDGTVIIGQPNTK